ncbi:hypothetical protein WICPIJ_000828 [Wickerhamomyces pijperi]|uniref:Importin N-terminal domain-containing protein n=1 Tax=Wickerhamomyces pijperi TaxID=599730 RepID=A0A9P8TR77_WICPI|nr:hypothetical protein WICPIJ_000828 [Wickerhamomyces pijperi]
MDDFCHLEIETIAQTIDSLYTTTQTDPLQIKQTESKLQEIQRSSNGLSIANSLLSNPASSLNVQFFASSTYLVQLTRRLNGLTSIELTKQDISILLSQVLNHTQQTVVQKIQSQRSNTFVTKKLFQVLSLIFVSFKPDWESPLESLSNLFQRIDPTNSHQKYFITLLLDFCDILTTSFLKLSKEEQMQHNSIHESIKTHTYPIFRTLISQCLGSASSDLQTAAISSITSWHQYLVNVVDPFTSTRYDSLFDQDMFQPLLAMLKTTGVSDELFLSVIMLLGDVFEERGGSGLSVGSMGFLKGEIMGDVSWVLMKFEYFLKKLDPEEEEDETSSVENFIDFIIKFHDIDLSKFTKTHMVHVTPMVEFLLQASCIQLDANQRLISDRISKRLIDFWCRVLEIYTDEFDIFQEEDETAQSEIRLNFKNLAWSLTKIYYEKIQLSSPPHYESEYKSEFQSFRTDSMELFDIIFTVLGPPMIEGVITTGMTSGVKVNINTIEAGFFILNSLCSNFSNHVDPAVLNALNLLLQQGEFIKNYDQLVQSASSNGSLYSAGAYVKTCSRFLATVTFVYKQEQQQQLLLTVMDQLLTWIKQYPAQELIISKAVLDICDECRSLLIDSMGRFEEVLIDVLPWGKVQDLTRSRIINAIGYVVQSMSQPQLQELYVSNLTRHIAELLVQSLNKDTNSEEISEYLTSLLGSIVSIGKGLNLPEDFKDTDPETYAQFLSYYSQSYKVQEQLLELAKNFDYFFYKEGFQQILAIFKVGLLDEFGPFVFKSEDIINYTSQRLSSDLAQQESTLRPVLELINRLIVCRSRSAASLHPQLPPQTIISIVKVYLMDLYPVIKTDPYLLISTFNILTTISASSSDPTLLLQDTEVMNFVIEIGYMQLPTYTEKFLIKAVCKFWTTLILMKSCKSSTQQSTVKQFIEFIGLQFTHMLFLSVFKSNRSDLDQYGGVIVALISKFPMGFNNWCKDCLIRINDERLSKGESPLDNIELFLKKLSLTRGLSSKTNAVLKEYWITANGLRGFI